MNTVLERVPAMQKKKKSGNGNCISEEGNINTAEIKWLFKISSEHFATSGWQSSFQTFERGSSELLILLDFYDIIVHSQKFIIFVTAS